MQSRTSIKRTRSPCRPEARRSLAVIQNLLHHRQRPPPARLAGVPRRKPNLAR
jgi:hypothetical protein